MADEKKILKMYNDLTPNEKRLVGVFVNAMVLSRNKNDRQSGNSITDNLCEFSGLYKHYITERNKNQCKL